MGDKLTVERFVVDTFLSNAYLVYSDNCLKEHKAIVIDPNISEKLKDRIKSLGINSLLIILTHEHFDHTTGVNGLQEEFNCKVLCQKNCADRVATKRHNRSLSIMSAEPDIRKYMHYPPYEIKTDLSFDDELQFQWCEYTLHLVHTPGHTKGACSIEIDDLVFVGDNLLPNIPVITRFPGGSQEEYEQITLPYLRTILQDRTIYPGHGEKFRKSDVTEKDGYFITK